MYVSNGLLARRTASAASAKKQKLNADVARPWTNRCSYAHESRRQQTTQQVRQHGTKRQVVCEARLPAGDRPDQICQGEEEAASMPKLATVPVMEKPYVC